MIHKSARTLAIFLLLVNGTAAMYGGWSLMTDPTGADLGLPSDWIFMIPFRDYFVPGVILFVVNGIFSILSAIATMSHSRGYEKFIMAQGILLTGWILVQVLMLRTIEVLHFAMAGIGLTMLVLGVILTINRIHNGYTNHGQSFKY
jgi:energy-converting hydrogenase Eha subunit C